MIFYIKKYYLEILIFLVLIIPKIYFLVISNNLGLFNEVAVYNSGDGGHYLKIAKNIFEYSVFSDNNSPIPTQAATWRPPLWPYILSFFFILTKNTFWLIIIKSFLELTLMLLAVFFIKKLELPGKKYILLFLLFLVEPYYLKYSITFLSESLTSVLVLLLVICFIIFSNSKRFSLLIPILSILVILCHPVSIFFVITLLVFYGIYNLKSSTTQIIIHSIIFIVLLSIWPYRNYITFKQGFYLTASQGATLSKGWNEKVSDNYTNVDGDLADELLNLKYIDNEINIENSSILKQSELYKKGTLIYIKSLNFVEALEIAFVKLKSNFNPFPEKEKEGVLEKVSIFFRILYLLVFLQCIFRFFKSPRFNFHDEKDRVHLVVLSILIGQSVMAVVIYSGLRFNAIYELALLFSFLYLNKNCLNGIIMKLGLKD